VGLEILGDWTIHSPPSVCGACLQCTQWLPLSPGPHLPPAGLGLPSVFLSVDSPCCGPSTAGRHLRESRCDCQARAGVSAAGPAQGSMPSLALGWPQQRPMAPKKKCSLAGLFSQGPSSSWTQSVAQWLGLTLVVSHLCLPLTHQRFLLPPVISLWPGEAHQANMRQRWYNA
jgi:hypothetical protein